MTAAYGLPDHLIDLVGAAVTEIAVHVLEPDSPAYELAFEWAERVDAGDHEDLLKPDDAASLYLVLREVAEYVFTNPTDYSVDVAFAVHADETLSFLGDVVHPERIAV